MTCTALKRSFSEGDEKRSQMVRQIPLSKRRKRDMSRSEEAKVNHMAWVVMTIKCSAKKR